MNSLCIALLFFPFHWELFVYERSETHIGVTIGPFTLAADWSEDQ